MSSQLSDAVRSLQRAKDAAVKRLTEIDRERRELRRSLKSLDSALKALDSGEATGRGTKPAPTTAMVTDVFLELLTEQQELPAQRLAELAGEKLAERGVSRAGLKLRIDQALADSRIENVAGMVRLNRGGRRDDE